MQAGMAPGYVWTASGRLLSAGQAIHRMNANAPSIRTTALIAKTGW